ncbi:MAG: CheY-like chemotaxis protein, partial [Paraglaciecola sp.]
LDGYEATRKIRQLPGLQDLPIIALTADVMQKNKDQAAQAGFTDHLCKPVDIEELSACLRKYIG